jgi:hypothetical protein
MVLLYAMNLGMFIGTSGCCHGEGCGKKAVVVAAVATVKTLDEGVKAFTDWAVKEEDKIVNASIAACSASTGPFGECVHAEAAKRREPIDRVKTALKFYDAALAGGQLAAGNGTLTQAAAALTSALAGVGVNVGGAL